LFLDTLTEATATFHAYFAEGPDAVFTPHASRKALYPQPASDKLTLTDDALSSSGHVTYNVINAQGQTVLRSGALVNGKSLSVSVAPLPVGVYTLEVFANGNAQHYKFSVLR
jgi:hypothetical protein